jgi:hypothetical protein
MTRTLTLASILMAAFSLPALAVDAPAAPAADAKTDASATAAQSAELTTQANADQARKLLLAQGYTNVSDLSRDNNGRWTGTATKDGKTIFVAIAVPTPTAEAAKASTTK